MLDSCRVVGGGVIRDIIDREIRYVSVEEGVWGERERERDASLTCLYSTGLSVDTVISAKTNPNSV